jgi:hypothetical protein
MDRKNVTPGAIEPRDHQHVRSDLEVPDTVPDRFLEDQPRVGRSLITLLRCLIAIHQRGLDPPDRMHNQRTVGHRRTPPGTAGPLTGT